ncbi:MAG: transposase [Brevinematales bacterium]|nr:transposase [Brevinematales bacterium]
MKRRKKRMVKSKIKRLQGFFVQVQEREISLGWVARKLDISRSWVTVLYQRFCRGESLIRPRTSRKSKLEQKHIALILETYEDLAIEKENKQKEYPSVRILSNTLYELYKDFPEVSDETIRRVLKKFFVHYPERARHHYRKRWQAEAIGEIVQGDVSTHQWVEKKPPFPLLLIMDDHSRYVLAAKFLPEDTIENHRMVWQEVFQEYGLPYKVYYDNDQKYSKKNNGLIAKAFEEIGICVINSRPYQPQGKGKIERKIQTFQKQVTFYIKKALKNKRIETLEQLNWILREYVIEHNNTPSRALGGRTPEEVFLEARRKPQKDLFKPFTLSSEEFEKAFALRDFRKLDKTYEVSYNGHRYRIPRENAFHVFPGVNIEVREFPGKWVKLFYKGHELAHYPFRETKIDK